MSVSVAVLLMCNYVCSSVDNVELLGHVDSVSEGMDQQSGEAAAAELG